ncbi:MAG: SDR family NAD(P)-dependent oxidoreductase [Pseudomonadota bacterium]
MDGHWIVLGASSAMARAFARRLAAAGCQITLTGRDTADLARTAADLTLRGAVDVAVLPLDLRAAASALEPLLAHAAAGAGPVSVAVFAGSMPPQAAVERDPGLLSGLVADNFTGAAALLLAVAPTITARGGTVVGVSSVAGDRGRVSNYAYGAAKAGFQTFLSGYRNRMARAGVHVMTVKPGFVDTAMTWGLPGLFLVASPEDVARDIETGLKRRRNVLYTPWFWLLIMTIIRLVPERVFKRLSI